MIIVIIIIIIHGFMVIPRCKQSKMRPNRKRKQEKVSFWIRHTALQGLAYALIGVPPRPLDQRSSSGNAACMQKWKPFRTEPNRGFSALRIGQSLSTCLFDKISPLSLSLSLSLSLFLPFFFCCCCGCCCCVCCCCVCCCLLWLLLLVLLLLLLLLDMRPSRKCKQGKVIVRQHGRSARRA